MTINPAIKEWFLKNLRTGLVIGALAAVSASSYAVEGMWQPEQLPLIKKDLKAKGLAIDPEALDNLTAYPMNAVVSLGGCGASFVSPLGLVVTNHHCAYGSIQYNSSKDKNLLEDGFLAKQLGDELPAAPGSRVLVTEEIKDVTASLLKGLEKVDGLKRYKTIEKRRKDIISKCESVAGYRCRIDSFLGQSSYRLTKQLEIQDVRLVQAPPSSIGKFGGDIDNWMWPRHTGDFAFYRAYVGKDGKPAAFSKDNVPYKPAGHLKIDTKGTENGDFVMVAGYPGRTNRHRLAQEVELTFNQQYPEVKKWLDSRIALIESMAKDRKEVGIAYAGRLAGLNNYSKNIEGKQAGFAALTIVGDKTKEEKAFVEYFQNKKNKEVVANYKVLNQLIAEEFAANELGMELRRAGESALLGAAKRIYKLSVEREKADADREPGYQERDMQFFKSRLVALTRRFDAKVDQALWLKGLSEVNPKTPELPKAYGMLLSAGDAKRQMLVADYYKKTGLLDQETRLGLMSKSRKELDKSKDPFIKLAAALYDDEKALDDKSKDRAGRFQKVRSAYMQAYKEYVTAQGQVLYSDANSTLRITYGTIQGYKNRAGNSYGPFTKLEEIAAKNTGKDPFKVPAKQLKLIKDKDYGSYKLDEIGTVPVNFLADLDITGGNSGSATLNDKGELTGLVFDGTIDGVISDWAFDPAFTRSIHVDVRYMLWVLEKFDEDSRLLGEMGVKSSLKQTH